MDGRQFGLNSWIHGLPYPRKRTVGVGAVSSETTSLAGSERSIGRLWANGFVMLALQTEACIVKSSSKPDEGSKESWLDYVGWANERQTNPA